MGTKWFGFFNSKKFIQSQEMKATTLTLLLSLSLTTCVHQNIDDYFGQASVAPDVGLDNSIKREFLSTFLALDEKPIDIERQGKRIYRLSIIPTIGKPYLIRLNIGDSISIITYKSIGDTKGSSIKTGVEMVELNYRANSVQLDSMTAILERNMQGIDIFSWTNDYDLEAAADGVWYLLEINDATRTTTIFRWSAGHGRAYLLKQSTEFEEVVRQFHQFVPECLLQPEQVTSEYDLLFSIFRDSRNTETLDSTRLFSDD